VTQALRSSIRARCFGASISEVIYVLNMQTSLAVCWTFITFLSMSTVGFVSIEPTLDRDGQVEEANTERIDSSRSGALEIHVDHTVVQAGEPG
jgi:hypothetical protein